ncbi:cyclic nucleotide-binding domain-containing protein [Cyanobium sp. FGCU-52]|nr:cyclic nucleotide-binding domain-containing protein [Cyanobium sp. FGCU52]
MAEPVFNAYTAMGEQLRQWLRNHARLRHAPDGSVLVREGVQDNVLFLVEKGSVRVRTTSPGEPATLADLGSGALFGEMAFLEGRLPVATVVAGPGCEVREVDEVQLAAAMAADPLLARDVYELLARKLAIQLRHQNTIVHRWPGVNAAPPNQALLLFAYLEEGDIDWLAANGRESRVPAGELLLEQGEPVPDLLILLHGSARVLLQQDARSTTVGQVRGGEMLGEMSLLGGSDEASASVQAVGSLTVLRVAKERLRSQLEADALVGARFFRAMAIVLSRWSRNQLLSHGLAEGARLAEGDATEVRAELRYTAEQRFARLRRAVLERSPEG